MYTVGSSSTIEEKLGGGITAIILGDTGIGKTTMAATFPSPIFLDLDQGGEFIDCPRILITEPDPRKALEDLQKAIGDLERAFSEPKPKYETIVLDTLDELVWLAKEGLMAEVGRARDRKSGGADWMSPADWDRLLNIVLPILRRLKRLPGNFVIVSQSKRFEVEGEETYWSLAAQSSARDIVTKMAGWIFHLVPTTSGTPMVLTRPTKGKSGVFRAKDRSGRLPPKIEPTWGAFITALKQTESTVEEPEATPEGL